MRKKTGENPFGESLEAEKEGHRSHLKSSPGLRNGKLIGDVAKNRRAAEHEWGSPKTEDRAAHLL